MAGPNDYTVQQPDIGGSLLGGIQAGQQLGAQQAAKDKQVQYQADLQSYMSNPSAQNAAAFTMKYPEQREAVKQSWDILGKDQQDSQFKSGVQVYNAIQNQRPEIAKQILDTQIEAMKNSGQDASSFEQIRESIDRNPDGTAATIGLTLSALEPDKWGKIMSETRAAAKAPYDLSESQAKAQKAAVDAKYAESNAAKDLEKKGWDIWKIGQDANIARQNSQIAAINSNIAREKNDLKRADLQMKLDDKIAARDLKVGEKAAEVTQGRSVIDNMLNTTDRFLNTPFEIIDAAAGPISSKTPTLSSDTADLEELVTTLSSQAFMAQIPALKGMGALSNAEGEKLQASLQNLSLRQSPERLTENVKEAARLMTKARANLSTKFGVPDVVPDTPASAPAPSVIDALIIKYGGQ